MNLSIKQVSSLEKIFPCGIGDAKCINRKTIMGGESFSYQIAIDSSDSTQLKVEVTSPFKDSIKLYTVKSAVMDFATYPNDDEDYLTKSPCLIPDILIPLDLEMPYIRLSNESGAIWVNVKVPENTKAAEYEITIAFSYTKGTETIELKQTLTLDVIPNNIIKQKTLFTQWFHVDCIADIHNVAIYSEAHWELIDKYMALASELGINMILTPVITPPIDTAVGSARPCTQLVKIEKQEKNYSFDFSLLKRWIKLCLKNNIESFEISHLFSQWGLKCAPNIKVTENGEESYLFGWHTPADSSQYRDFLNQFIPALIEFLRAEGIKERCWFHISDEPSLEHLEAYEYAHSIVKPLVDGCPTFDAISNYEFFDKGLIQIPVTSNCHIEPFIENKVKNQWVYYCCAEHNKVGNRFLAMPSYRNRILGLQMYKYNIDGFLHWGYNFYYSQFSRDKINPYITTSSDKAFPSGDPFSVYPIQNGVVPSLRALIFKEALQDIEICRMLESFIGREKVIEMIDSAAGMNLTFSEYPRNNDYIPELIEKMEQMIKEYINN